MSKTKILVLTILPLLIFSCTQKQDLYAKNRFLLEEKINSITQGEDLLSNDLVLLDKELKIAENPFGLMYKTTGLSDSELAAKRENAKKLTERIIFLRGKYSETLVRLVYLKSQKDSLQKLYNNAGN